MNKFKLIAAILALCLSGCASDKKDGTATVKPPMPELVPCAVGQLPDLPGNQCFKK